MKSPRLPLKPHLFGRLQWHLTLSYMKVTFGTTVATLGLILVLIGLVVTLSPEVPRGLAKALHEVTPELRPLLRPKPNVPALQRWLNDSKLLSKDVKSIHVNFDDDSAEVVAVVYAPDGTVIASRPRGQRVVLGALEQRLIARARTGERQPSRLSGRLPDAVFVAAVPILSKGDSAVEGVLFCKTPPAFRIADALIAFLVGILPIGLVIALSSGLVAGISGYLSARRLTRRLDQIARAADCWARGDFSVSAPEAGDEMGLLAARLNRMAAELQDLLALKSDIATLEERNRLARDLHDTVKQQIFATAMQVAAARALLPEQPDSAKSRLDIANDMAQQAQRDLTAVLHELRPISAESAPLAILLKGQVADWGRRTGVKVEFLSDSNLPPLMPESANGLLRIAQEALTNADKHSAATRVEVSLQKDDSGGVRLLVRDNGRGFDKRQRSGGLGLHSMRERAELLPGGRFQVLAAPGAGTCIIARCDTSAL